MNLSLASLGTVPPKGDSPPKRGQSPLGSEELDELCAKGLFRKLLTLTDLRGTHALWEGKELILFCGNDYLGLAHHPRMIGAASKALEKYGVGSGASRLISGTSDLHTQLEETLARFMGKERALVFGSGYLANLGILGALAGERDLIVMDKLCHASIIDGARLSQATLRIFPHKNYSKCGAILEKSTNFRRRILVSETVFSMEGDLADLPELVRLKEKYDALLVVDEAHAIGVFGERGRGGASGGIEEKIDGVMGTLSKAIGVFGGFVAGSSVLIERLINFSRSFIFATAPPPALMAAALVALRLIQEEPSVRERLWQNVDRVHEILTKQGFCVEKSSPIFPIPIGAEREAVRVSESLLEQGILIPAIRYPTVPKGKARLRLTVSAAHTEGDLEKLFQALTVIARRPLAQ